VNLPAGGSVTYTASCTISAAATGTLSNTATVTAPGGVNDPTPGNNSATDSDTLSPQADLSVTKVDTPDPVTAGNNLTYTITVTNAGPSVAASVALSDTLPAGTTFVSLASSGGWSCTTPAVGAGGAVSCSNPSFGLAGAVFTLVVKVDPSASGTVLSNTATVSSATADPVPGNNSATATTTVSALDYFTVAACRAVDTRGADAPPLAANATRAFPLAGLCGIPAGAKLVAVNLTVVGPQAPGHLEVFPGDQSTPSGLGVVNFSLGQTRSNNAIVLLATDGSGTVKVLSATSGQVKLLVDVVGYFE